MGVIVAYSPWGRTLPHSHFHPHFPCYSFTCRVSLSSSPSNLHQTKLYAVFVSTCLSSQTIPVWVIDDDHSLSPDTPPCWDKHCKHGCPVRFLLYFFGFLHSVGFAFGLLLLTPYLTTVNYHQGWVDLVLSLSLFLEYVLVTSIHIRSRHTYIQTDRQIQTRRWFLLFWRRLLLPLIYCWSWLCCVITLILRTGWLVGWLPGVILLLYNTLNYRQSILWMNMNNWLAWTFLWLIDLISLCPCCFSST